MANSEPSADQPNEMHLSQQQTCCPAPVRKVLQRGVVLPAHPLALDARRKLDERSQRALARYYVAAGAGGLAVGVHTTQFQIHNPCSGLLEPVLTIAREEMDRADQSRQKPLVRVAGICGKTAQAVIEAELARDLGYHCGLLNFSEFSAADEPALLAHCRAVARVLPLFGFCLQASLGGLRLSRALWTRFCEIEQVVAIKIAPFNRYQTLDLIHAVADSGRTDIALYTGNDDHIVLDLLLPYSARGTEGQWNLYMVGGLLGHWALWTKKAVELLDQCHHAVANGLGASPQLLLCHTEVTDMNAAIFDATNEFRGCLPGISEVLSRQGLVATNLCLDEEETLSAGQKEEIDRVMAAYPHQRDDAFVAEHLDEWRR